ncbi:hypothetical protein B7494_g2865 [Chlorociboria aeruginascens]|nr:hypothetical protein B7494_g2865 [Chlorociboria aeruginascens]
MATLSIGDHIFILFFKVINKVVPWHKLPPWLGALNIVALRLELRAKNLYDVYPTPISSQACPMSDSRYLTTRHSDGLFNSLKEPHMGCRSMRFGRNVPRHLTRKPTDEELLTPNPRYISEQLLKRTVFKPAETLNLLAAAWIQFQVHDWANHVQGTDNFEVPLPAGDHWPSGHVNVRSMKVPRSVPDAPLSKTDISCPAYENTNTAWWDASQIYGSDEAATTVLRGAAINGKLAITEKGHEGFLPRAADGLPQTGFNSNWWLGLELLHTLFALEHNAICDRLLEKNCHWSSDQLFDTARIINCALMAKIHTVEWTPAILGNPTLNLGMHANWWGLVGEKLNKAIGRVSKNELIGGIPGSGVDQDNVPFSITEEFVSVYRLHALIPGTRFLPWLPPKLIILDDIAFFNVHSGKHTKTMPMEEVAFEKAQYAIDPETSMGDAFYSFGINYPGKITHNNTPNFLRNLHTPDGIVRDMGTIDIFRDRERGVPRYCAFRRLFHMTAPKTFLELTGGNAPLAAQLRSVYDNNLEKVDLQIGMLCEPFPEGFGFSDTAFRVFILMATRRIKSDRFLAGDAWKEEVYTKEGMDWVQNETMTSVLTRHFPELRPALIDLDNPFKPWKKVGLSGDYRGKETTA